MRADSRNICSHFTQHLMRCVNISSVSSCIPRKTISFPAPDPSLCIKMRTGFCSHHVRGCLLHVEHILEAQQSSVLSLAWPLPVTALHGLIHLPDPTTPSLPQALGTCYSQGWKSPSAPQALGIADPLISFRPQLHNHFFRGLTLLPSPHCF